jgi:hypothetical protein
VRISLNPNHNHTRNLTFKIFCTEYIHSQTAETSESSRWQTGALTRPGARCHSWCRLNETSLCCRLCDETLLSVFAIALTITINSINSIKGIITLIIIRISISISIIIISSIALSRVVVGQSRVRRQPRHVGQSSVSKTKTIICRAFLHFHHS